MEYDGELEGRKGRRRKGREAKSRASRVVASSKAKARQSRAKQSKSKDRRPRKKNGEESADASPAFGEMGTIFRYTVDSGIHSNSIHTRIY